MFYTWYLEPRAGSKPEAYGEHGHAKRMLQLRLRSSLTFRHPDTSLTTARVVKQDTVTMQIGQNAIRPKGASMFALTYLSGRLWGTEIGSGLRTVSQ